MLIDKLTEQMYFFSTVSPHGISLAEKFHAWIAHFAVLQRKPRNEVKVAKSKLQESCDDWLKLRHRPQSAGIG